MFRTIFATFFIFFTPRFSLFWRRRRRDVVFVVAVVIAVIIALVFAVIVVVVVVTVRMAVWC